MPKLVEGFAARLRVPTGKRDVHVWDDALPGFGIRKFESGKKYCIVKFTVNGQQRKLSLGLAVPGVLAEMRKKASDILARAKIGQDIVEEKRAASRTGAPPLSASWCPSISRREHRSSATAPTRNGRDTWSGIGPLFTGFRLMLSSGATSFA
jgi:hypothetical protein